MPASRDTENPIRIVIADDHAISGRWIAASLSTQDDFHVVAEAPDGKEAIALATELRPDVLLLDLAMPRVPGMEVLRELARQELPLRTILLTAAIQPFAVTSALQLRARGSSSKHRPPSCC